MIFCGGKRKGIIEKKIKGKEEGVRVYMP